MSVFHIGDHIAVRDDLIGRIRYPYEDKEFVDPDSYNYRLVQRGLFCAEDMQFFRGKYGFITEVLHNKGEGIRYRIDVDYGQFYWCADMLLDRMDDDGFDVLIDDLFGGCDS